MKQNVIVLSASQYRIVNDNTGEIENEGCTVHYVLSDNLSQIADEHRKTKGYKPAKATIAHGDFNNFPAIPGVYDVAFVSNVDSKGKLALVPSKFEYVSGIRVIGDDVIEV